MKEVTRRNTLGIAVGMALVGLNRSSASGVDAASKSPPLDAVLHVAVTSKGTIQLRFDTPASADQEFDSSEYRYAVLDDAGIQVTSPRIEAKGALLPTGMAYHPVALPKGKKSVADYSELTLDHRRLKPGKEYFLVVSVRNLTALAKFESP